MVSVMLLNATFNNISSVIWWRSALLVYRSTRRKPLTCRTSFFVGVLR